MQTPSPPQLRSLQHISPSLYASARSCGARAGWAVFGKNGDFPETPAALLGRAFHITMGRAAVEGQHGSTSEIQSVSRNVFNVAANELHSKAHPLLRAKFPRTELLPYYYLVRERVALAALEVANVPALSTHGPTSAAGVQQRRAVEKRLRSSDGLLVGQPDLVEAPQREVFDYKTNLGPQGMPDAVSDAETSQLRLYAYLLQENGVAIERGTIVRANGTRLSVPISEDDARKEADAARQTLTEFNRSVSAGGDFGTLARPSAEVCKWCPCLPMCEPFWQAAQPEWAPVCGSHVEGTVLEVEESNLLGTPLVSLVVQARRGTCGIGNKTIEQIPQVWLTAGGSSVPRPSDVVRAVHVRIGQPDAESIKVDRMSSAVWTAPGDTGGSV